MDDGFIFTELCQRPSRNRLENLIAAAELSVVVAQSVRELHEHLERSHQSTELLRALYDTATDLTAMRDVEAVLQAIVRRTRVLTGADMAYISLNDHIENETYIRKSDGVATAAYRSIRMPLGKGVLGKAATGLAPVQTLDYLADVSIDHLADIDRIVADEGVKAILGVPMSVHGVVRGALMIANRRPTTFPPEIIDIVDTIGRHAAVALDNAQRFAEVTSAVARLGSERDVDQERLLALNTLVALDERLLDSVIEGGGVTALAAIASQTFGADVVVLDADHEILTQSGGELPDWSWLAVASSRTRAAGIVVAQDGVGKTWTMIAAIAGRQHLATLAVGVAGVDRSQLQRVALYLSATRLFDLAADQAQRRHGYELLDDLIAGRAVPQTQLESRLRRAGLDPKQPMTLVVVATTEAALLRRALRQTPVLLASHHDHQCLLHNGIEPKLVSARQLFTEAGQGLLAVYVAGLERIADIGEAHRQAEAALVGLTTLGVSDAVVNQELLGSVGAVLAAYQDGRLGRSPVASILPLIEYDRKYETKLVETAWLWLEYGSDIAATARALFVHQNTVRQRLGRVTALLGADWAGPISRLESHLALKIAVLARTLANPTVE